MATPHQRQIRRRVLRQITEHPESHEQAIWIDGLERDAEGKPMAGKGTRACIGGWALLFDGLLKLDEEGDPFSADSGDYLEEAAHSLGLTREQMESIAHNEFEDSARHRFVMLIALGEAEEVLLAQD